MKQSSQTPPRGANVLVSLMLLVAIAAMINYLSDRHYTRSDWTAAQRYSLSPKSESVARSLKQPVEVHVLWSNLDPAFDTVKELLSRYGALSPQLIVNYIDPDRNPEKFEAIQAQYGKTLIHHGGQVGVEAGLIFVRGDRTKFVSEQNFYQLEQEQLGDTPVTQLHAEQQITSALVNINQQRQQTVCFTIGHGEWGDLQSGKRHLNHLKRELELDAFNHSSVHLLQSPNQMQQCDVLVVAGPKEPFFNAEVGYIENFYRQGKSVMLLLDPLAENTPTGFEALLRRNGIALDQRQVIETDPRRLVKNEASALLVDRFYEHDATRSVFRPLGAAPVLLSSARPLKQLPNDDAIVDILASSSAMSFGKDASLPPVDKEGPLPLVVSTIREFDGHTARMVVVGDSDFLKESYFSSAGLHNRDMWSGLLGWLTARDELTRIPPKDAGQVQLMMTQQQYTTLMMSVFTVFAAIVLFGILIIWQRRK